jgi:hypothetical protein
VTEPKEKRRKAQEWLRDKLEHLKRDDLGPKDLADVLALVIVLNDQQGSNRLVPVSLLHRLGDRIFLGWPKALNEARSHLADLRHTSWQAQANTIWADHPDWSATRVGRKIIEQIPKDERPKLGTVRKAIKKK